MKYIKTLVGALLATALFATVAVAAPSTNAPVASASDELGTWTLSLSGNGSTDLKGDNGSAVGGEIQVGKSVTLVTAAEFGLRQGIGYADKGANNWLLSTKAYSDWTVVKLGNLQFDAGANVGINYGNTKSTWSAAPEVVGRIYLKKDVDFFARVEYPFDLTNGKATDSLAYTLGIRVRF